MSSAHRPSHRQGGWRHPCPRSLTRVQPRAAPPDPDPGKAPPTQEPAPSSQPRARSSVAGFTACEAAPCWKAVPRASLQVLFARPPWAWPHPRPAPPGVVMLSARQAGSVSLQVWPPNNQPLVFPPSAHLRPQDVLNSIQAGASCLNFLNILRWFLQNLPTLSSRATGHVWT